MKKHIIFSLVSVLALSAYAQQTCNPNIQATTQLTIDAGGLTATDSQTGLMWMRCSLGQSGNDCSTGNATQYNWQQALESVATTNATSPGGYNDWRLPNSKELASIVEVKCVDPAINLTIFPNTVSDRYWSSSPKDFSSAWYVSFNNGQFGDNLKTIPYFVRLVRDM